MKKRIDCMKKYIKIIRQLEQLEEDTKDDGVDKYLSDAVKTARLEMYDYLHHLGPDEEIDMFEYLIKLAWD